MSTCDWIKDIKERGREIPHEVFQIVRAIRTCGDNDLGAFGLLQIADILEDLGGDTQWVIDHLREHATDRQSWYENAPCSCWVVLNLLDSQQ